MTEERKQEIALRDKSYLLASDIALPIPEDLDGYALALHMTGVKVLGYEEFGSYQGDWWAHIQFPSGERYFLHDYYGSCSGCDAFQAEIDHYNAPDRYDANGRYVSFNDRPSSAHKLRDFGREYLSNCLTFEQAIAQCQESSNYDMTAEKTEAWVRNQHAGAATETILTIEGTAK